MIFAPLQPHEQKSMNDTIAIDRASQIELRVKGGSPISAQLQWACLRFLGEDEIVNLLQDRLGKSEAEVRQVLEAYHQPVSPL